MIERQVLLAMLQPSLQQFGETDQQRRYKASFAGLLMDSYDDY